LSRVIEEPDSKEPMECPAEKQKYLIYWSITSVRKLLVSRLVHAKVAKKVWISLQQVFRR
jgi:hypothetical protein